MSVTLPHWCDFCVTFNSSLVMDKQQQFHRAKRSAHRYAVRLIFRLSGYPLRRAGLFLDSTTIIPYI